MQRELGLILLTIIAGGGAFAACSSPEDPVSDPAGGASGIVECAATTSCGTCEGCCTTTTSCSGTIPTTEQPSLTTTLTCSPPVSGGACTPGSVIACFDGPADALVSPCAAGT